MRADRRDRRGRAARARAGFTLIELLVVVVIIGILASVSLPNMVAAQDRARNAAAASNLNVVRLALEQYGADNRGVFPANADIASAAGLCQNNYMPGNRMPLSPWCKNPQTVRIEPTIQPGLYAEDLAAGETRPAPGTLLNTTSFGAVADPPTTTLHYGAITSDCDDAGDRTKYALCAIGKKGRRALIAGALSNTGQ